MQNFGMVEFDDLYHIVICFMDQFECVVICGSCCKVCGLVVCSHQQFSWNEGLVVRVSKTSDIFLLYSHKFMCFIILNSAFLS